jgi:protein required for attachment to host cells
MATDPVERIRSEQRKTPFSLNLRERVHDLAHLEPSTGKEYVSVYIDWRPEGENPNVRPGKVVLEKAVADHRRHLRDAGIDTVGFDADVERIMMMIEDGIDPAVQGIFVLANDTRNIFEVVLLALPFETQISVSPTPSLRTLIAVVEDYPRFAVLHADQHDASLFVINRASPQSEMSIESNEYPRKQSQGGWSQRRFQARQDERVQHFARAVGEEVRRVLDEEKIDMLIMSAGEVFSSALSEEMHQSVKERIVGEIRLPANAGEREIFEEALKVAEQAERAREAANISKLEDSVGAGNHGASGPDEVLQALTNGQVALLLMADDFEADGWADHTMSIYGVGAPPDEHPANGNLDSVVKVDLSEEIIRLALSTGARVEIVPGEHAARLHRHGGVGALLRY